MKYLGDITKINGATVPSVNVIIGGSPCQDLSVAGKRAGLSGERSGLFMEQLRIIKEMRQADENRGRTGKHIRPRFMVWENVPGAFSSNKGADFGAVLQETIRVICKETPDIPMPDKGWPTAGALVGMGGDWSVAWRVLDAQFWGVPQRRRRIALVADFGGATAPEILFERKSVSGDTSQGEKARQASAGHFEAGVRSTGKAGLAYCIQGNCIDRADNAGCNGKGWREDKSYTLNTVDRPAVYAVDQGGGKSGANVSEDVSPTLTCTHGGEPAVYDARGNGDGKIVPTITGDHNDRITDYSAVLVNGQVSAGFKYGAGSNAGGVGYEKEKAPTLSAMTHDASVIVSTIQPPSFGIQAHGNGEIVATEELHPRLTTGGGQPGQGYPCTLSKNNNQSMLYTIRRLTPLECERLQGFPDGWTDIGDWMDSKGKKRVCSDTSRYKALGNSIAIPPWLYVLSKLSLYCSADNTMASLFDGIGGFPYIWEKLHGKGSCLWASEIEEFPIAVTKYHFGEEV